MSRLLSVLCAMTAVLLTVVGFSCDGARPKPHIEYSTLEATG